MRSANRAIRRKVRLPKRQLIGSCPRGSKNWWGVRALGGRRYLGRPRIIEEAGQCYIGVAAREAGKDLC